MRSQSARSRLVCLRHPPRNPWSTRLRKCHRRRPPSGLPAHGTRRTL